MADTTLLGRLIARDGSRCVWCGRELWRSDLTAEHLLPRSRRGHGTLDNLAVACRRCNRARGTQAVATYVRSRREAGDDLDVATLLTALERLGRSTRRVHADYGARQRELVLRLAEFDGARGAPTPGSAAPLSAPVAVRADRAA